MSDGPTMSRRRATVTVGLQWAFMIAVAIAIVVAWADQGDAVTAALSRANLIAVTIAVVGGIGALVSLVPHWRAIARSLGTQVERNDARAIVVSGQLGKYIPGGIWTIGAQGFSAHRARLDWRLGVAVGLLQLATLVALGLGIGGVLVLTGATPLSPWWGLVGVGAAVVAFLPPVLRRAGRLLLRDASGSSSTAHLLVFATAVPYWVASIVSAGASAYALGIENIIAVVAAAALAYAAGALVIIAPAGIGVREAVIIGTLAPVAGVSSAAALAVLLRLSAVMGDLIGAATLTILRRRSAASRP